MHKFTTDLSPRLSIRVQPIDIIIIVYNPDSSISTNTNINSTSRNLIPIRITVYNWNRFNYWNRLLTRRCPLINALT